MQQRHTEIEGKKEFLEKLEHEVDVMVLEIGMIRKNLQYFEKMIQKRNSSALADLLMAKGNLVKRRILIF